MRSRARRCGAAAMSGNVVPASAAAIAEAARLLASGKLVAFPTETVYGLGADAANADAVQEIFAVKGRPADHPVIVHIPGRDHLGRWAREVSRGALALADAFWPGPLTLILPRGNDVLDPITGGQDSIGLRFPSHPVARALLDAFGGGIAAPSANRFGHVSPTTAQHVAADLGGDWITAPDNAADYARDLYANLRALDAANADAILIEAPPDDPSWLAIRDRLTRATQGEDDDRD